MGNWIQGASGIWTQKVWDSRPNRLEPETLAYLTSNPNASRDWWNIDQNIKQIKYASGVVLNAVTCNLSVVDGTAFITNPSVDLRPYIGCKLSISDGSKALVGFGKAVGTGETLGDELIDTWTNGSAGVAWDTLTLSGSDIVSAIQATDSTTYCYKAPATPLGALLKGSITAYTKSSGVDPTFRIGAPDVSLGAGAVIATAASGLNLYGTQTAAQGTSACGFRTYYASSFSASGISVKQVLTPSSTGITIVSTKDGTTYNWASNGGINANAASYTVTITKE